jgi:hypothetical protein
MSKKIKIVKREDPINLAHLIMLLYGDPGGGKTSATFTIPKSLNMDFDRGAHRSEFRGDTVQVESWDQVANLTAKDLEGYDTIVIDTVGRQLDLITAHLAANDSKLISRTGQLSLQGYATLKAVFTSWIKRLQTFGLDIVMVAHAREDKRTGDEVVQRPDIQGGSYAEVLKLTDMVGFLSRGDKGTLDFSPTATHIGKNAPGLPPLDVPNFHKAPTFLGDVIANAKATINERNHVSQVVADKVKEVRELVEAAQSADEVNGLVTEHVMPLKESEVKEDQAAAVQVGDLLKQQAKELGLRYDKAESKFIAPESASVAA